MCGRVLAPIENQDRVHKGACQFLWLLGTHRSMRRWGEEPQVFLASSCFREESVRWLACPKSMRRLIQAHSLLITCMKWARNTARSGPEMEGAEWINSILLKLSPSVLATGSVQQEHLFECSGTPPHSSSTKEMRTGLSRIGIQISHSVPMPWGVYRACVVEATIQ